MPHAYAPITAPAAEPMSVAEAKLTRRLTDTSQDLLLPGLITASRVSAETVTRRALMAQRWSLWLDCFPRPAMNIASANWYGPQWGTSPGPLSTARVDGTTGFEIILDWPPLQVVESITYIDQNGAPQTLDPSQYLVDKIRMPARITPAYNTTWPATQNQANAVTVTFVVGHAMPFTVSGNTLTLAGANWPLVANTAVRLAVSGGCLPEPLLPQTDYYVKSPSGSTLQLAATSGGPAIGLTDTGTDDAIFLLGGARLDDLCGIRVWMFARLGSVFRYREEVAVLSRGKVDPLPFVDSLLDPYRVIEY